MESPAEKTIQQTRMSQSLTNHSPSGDQVRRIEGVRKYGIYLSDEIIRSSEPSRERSLALTHVEETVMWAVKSIILES